MGFRTLAKRFPELKLWESQSVNSIVNAAAEKQKKVKAAEKMLEKHRGKSRSQLDAAKKDAKNRKNKPKGRGKAGKKKYKARIMATFII